MDKKPLIGISLCAVVLLVLGSLSNVVGYQSVKSTSVTDSPLYSVRTKQAINQESKNTLKSDYLRKGIAVNFQCAIRENRTLLLQQIINIIRKMNDKELHRFQSIVLSYLNKIKGDNKIDINNVLSEKRKNNVKYTMSNQELPYTYTIGELGNKASIIDFLITILTYIVEFFVGSIIIILLALSSLIHPTAQFYCDTVLCLNK